MVFVSLSPQFTLSIPDSKDVKDAFGVMAVTIVEQERQIGKLQGCRKKNCIASSYLKDWLIYFYFLATIIEMAQENERRQKEIIAWTTNCLEEVRAQNAMLASKLSDAESQLKNVSYNIQGYADGDRNTEVKMQALNVMKTFEVGLSDGQARKVISITGTVALSMYRWKLCVA
jgi:hypothetical protein